MMALQGQSNSKTYITREIYETISVCLFRYFGFRKCGGYKLRSRISEGLINFKDFSLKFNTEQWSGIPRGLCHKKNQMLLHLGLFLILAVDGNIRVPVRVLMSKEPQLGLCRPQAWSVLCAEL